MRRQHDFHLEGDVLLHTKLTKLLNLTTSENDNEALSAIRAANNIVKKSGLSWELILLRDSPPPPRQMDDDYPDIQDMINSIWLAVDDDFDSSFLASVEKQYKRRGKLTDNQIRGLQNIYDNWVK